MRIYILLGFGTFGKMVVRLVLRLLAFYGREPVASAAFDSNRHDSLSAFVLPVADVPQVDVSLDGQDLREALERGEFPRLRGVDAELLKATRVDGGFSLYPGVGLAAATVNQRTLRDTLRRLCQAASDIVTTAGGEVVVVRCFSSFGGTSRGLVWESSEALLDIAEEAGLRLHLLDLVATPGLGTSTSRFNQRYLRNTCAFVKETAAFRAEAFHPIVWDEEGRARSARSAALPSTLALLSDTSARGHTLTLDVHAAMVARFFALLTRPAFSGAFWEAYVDLTRHGTKRPFAARLGLYSIVVPAREETLARHYRAVVRCLERLIKTTEDADAQARELLLRLGLRAPDTSRLRLLDTVRTRLLGRLGHDPVTTLGGLFAQRPADYFDEYQELVAELRAAEPEALGREGAEELGKSPALGEELARLRVALLPGAVLATLRRAVVLLDDDQRELAAAVEDVGQERIEEEERAAGAAQEAYDALRRRWWRRLLGLRGGRVQDALEQVKDHLRAALERRVEFLCLRVFVVILDELLADLRGGSLPAWATTLEQAEALIAALREAQAGIEALHARIGCAPGTYRGPATTKPLPRAQEPTSEAGPEAHLDRVRPILPTLYGASADAVRREMAERLLGPLGDMLRMPMAQLTAESLSEADLRDAAIKSAPLSPIDGTRGSGLRARFVLAPGGDASPLKPLANLAWASAGQVDRERWVDAGPELADELTIVTFEEGDPLDAFKGLREASGADRTAGDREDSHLEPLFTLLPDPVTYTAANGDEQRRVILLGLAAGALRRVGGGFRYVGDDGAERAFDPASYAMAAAIASRFVARVRTAGFARVVRELPRLPGNAWGAAARRLVEDLERLAERYHEPSTAARGATR